MTILTQSEFARAQGWSRSHVTALKQAGRLVLADDGRVDVEASLARIAATRGGGRDDVAARHAAARGKVESPPLPQEPGGGPAELESPIGVEGARAQFSERLLQFENAQIKLELALRRHKRYARLAALGEATALGGMLRAVLERLIDQTAPRLAAARDAGRRQDILRAEVKRLKRAVKAEFPAALRRLRRR
jgi:hypothetical protein